MVGVSLIHDDVQGKMPKVVSRLLCYLFVIKCLRSSMTTSCYSYLLKNV
jgi:hypothetical protein